MGGGTNNIVYPDKEITLNGSLLNKENVFYNTSGYIIEHFSTTNFYSDNIKVDIYNTNSNIYMNNDLYNLKKTRISKTSNNTILYDLTLPKIYTTLGYNNTNLYTNYICSRIVDLNLIPIQKAEMNLSCILDFTGKTQQYLTNSTYLRNPDYMRLLIRCNIIPYHIFFILLSNYYNNLAESVRNSIYDTTLTSVKSSDPVNRFRNLGGTSNDNIIQLQDLNGNSNLSRKTFTKKFIINSGATGVNYHDYGFLLIDVGLYTVSYPGYKIHPDYTAYMNETENDRKLSLEIERINYKTLD